MKTRILCILLVVCLLFSACSAAKPPRSVEAVKKKLLTTAAYTCDVTLKVTNNRSTMEYKMKHFYKSPGLYRIELLSPEKLSGQITVSDGKVTYVYSPKLNTALRMEDFEATPEHAAFVGSFLHYFKLLNRAKVSKESIDGIDYFVLELKPFKDSRYMNTEKLWVEAATATPKKLEIYNKEQKMTVEVLYENYNNRAELEDKMFEIPQK